MLSKRGLVRALRCSGIHLNKETTNRQGKNCRATQTDVTSSSPLQQWFTHVRDKSCEGTLHVSRQRSTAQAPSLLTKVVSSFLQNHFVVSHSTLGIWNSLDSYSVLIVWAPREAQFKTHQLLQFAVRFIAVLGKHVSEQREVTVYQILQLTELFIEILGNTCLNRKRGQSTPASVNCDPVLTAPLGMRFQPHCLDPMRSSGLLVVQHSGNHITQHVEPANVR